METASQPVPPSTTGLEIPRVHRSRESPISRVALVTGAGSGIGKACAIRLASAGFACALVGRRLDPLESVAALIRAERGEALALACDVTQEDQVQAAFRSAVQKFGRLDVLFNNAGINIAATPIAELSIDAWREVVDINLTGSFLCAREAFRVMKGQEPVGGRIINNGSISAHVPRPLATPYTATKHAITGLTRSLSLEGRAYDIACGQIDIGNAESEMTAKMSAGVLQANGHRAPEPTFDVRHVADAVAYMASLPLDANVQFMTVMATAMPYIGRG